MKIHEVGIQLINVVKQNMNVLDDGIVMSLCGPTLESIAKVGIFPHTV